MQSALLTGYQPQVRFTRMLPLYLRNERGHSVVECYDEKGVLIGYAELLADIWYKYIDSELMRKEADQIVYPQKARSMVQDYARPRIPLLDECGREIKG